MAARPTRARPPVAIAAMAVLAAGAAAMGVAATGVATASVPPSTPAPAATGDSVPFDPSERIVAVEDDGTVVVIAVGPDGPADDPFAVFEAGDDFVDGVALDADRAVAFVGICCGPGTTHVMTPDGGELATHDGSAPVSSPDRRSIAYVSGTSLLVEDVASGEMTTIDTDAGDSFTAFDVMWLDDDRLLAFGATATQAFELRSYDVRSGELTAAAPATDGAEPNLLFAGLDPAGRVVALDVPREPAGPAAVWHFDPTTLAPVDVADGPELPAGVRSAALDASGTRLLVVGADGVASIGTGPDAVALDGTYRWAAWA